MTKEQRQYNGSKIVFSTNVSGTTGHPKWGKIYKLHINFISLTKINSKCIIDLSAKHKTTKLLGENVGENRP